MALAHSVEEVLLDNGATGLLITTPGTQTVRVDVQFRAGLAYAPRPDISQVAHVMEHLALGANESFPTQQAFSREFTRHGAYSNAYTSNLDMTYMADFARSETIRILKLLELSVTKPVFTSEALKAEKGNVTEELKGYESNNFRVIWQEVMKASGTKRWHDKDELKTIDAITLEDVTAHFKKTHQSANMRFVISGDIEDDRDEIVSCLEAWDIPRGHALPVAPQRAHSGGLVALTRKEAASVDFLVSFFINRHLTRQEVTTMNTLIHILTGTFHSLIWGVARSEGICYGMGSWLDTSTEDMTEWSFNGQVSVENAPRLFELIASVVGDVRHHSVSEDDLSEAIEYRLGSLEMGAETSAGLANWYSDYYFDDKTINHVDAFPARYKATTTEDIRKLVDEFLGGSVWSMGVIGAIGKPTAHEWYASFADALHLEKK